MAKPKRKHPSSLSWAAESPQGAWFLNLMEAILGEDRSYAPVERTRDGAHVYFMQGSLNQGFLVEAREIAEGEEWMARTAFRCEPVGLPVVYQIELVSHRWDPWLHAEATGDRRILEWPAERRSAVRDRRNAEIAPRKDRVQMWFGPAEQAPEFVAGLPREELEAIKRKHGIVDRIHFTLPPENEGNGHQDSP